MIVMRPDKYDFQAVPRNKTRSPETERLLAFEESFNHERGASVCISLYRSTPATTPWGEKGRD